MIMGQAAEFFDNLESGSDIKDEGDFLGGFSPFESDIYDFTITSAYLSKADSGAKCLNVSFKDAKGKELKQSFWYTSGTAKGGKNFYINQKTLEKHFLPGFTMAKHLALLAVGKELQNLVIEERPMKLYSREAKAEVVTPVAMCVEMIGKSVSVGVVKRIVDKTKETGAVDENGKKVYMATGETRTENEAVKLFRTRDKMTVTEIIAKVETAEFSTKWLERWKGQTEDRTKKVNGTAGAPVMGTPQGDSTTGPDLGTLFN